MTDQAHDPAACAACSSNRGCTARYTDTRKDEEISSAPYLVIAGVIVVAISALIQWLL
jgi:hypothetical protein